MKSTTKELISFNPKARTGAHDLYDLLVKYGPRILTSDEGRILNRSVCEVFLGIQSGDVEKFRESLKRLNNSIVINLEVMKEYQVFFLNYSAYSPLKTLNRYILGLLEGESFGDNQIEEIIEKMRFNPLKTKLKTKTFLAPISEEVTKRYIKESVGVPRELKEIDRRSIKLWVNEITEKGIDEVVADKQWGDHSLGLKEVFKGKRSVCLSDAGRVIYRVDEKISGDTLTKIITIIRITSTHDYSEE